SARARSEGFHEETNGTSTKAAPSAPVAAVAVVRNLRRLLSTSSSDVMTPFWTVNLELSRLLPIPPRLTGHAHQSRTGLQFPASGGRRIIHKRQCPPGRTVERSDAGKELGTRTSVRGRFNRRRAGARIRRRGAATGSRPAGRHRGKSACGSCAGLA